MVGGYGVVWGGQDVTREFFTPETDFWFDRLTETPMVLYNHGQDDTVKRVVVGKVTSRRVDDMGLWIEAQITAARKYANAIRPLVEKGVLGWSSGAIGHLVDRTKHADGRTHITSWPVAEWSLTPTPAEPRTIGVRALKSLGIELPADDYEVEDGTKAHESDIDAKPYRVEKQGNQYVVLGPTGRRMGRHKTRSGALRQQRALYANEGKSSPMTEPADSVFAFIEPGADLEDAKKRRHYPHHSEDGSIDHDLLLAALEDAPRSELGRKAYAHLKRHAIAEGIDVAGDHDDAHNSEWADGGAPASLLLVGQTINDLAGKVAGELVAMRVLGNDTKSNRRIQSETRQALKEVMAQLAEVISWAETVDRGEDGRAYVDRMKAELELLELETGGLIRG